MVGPLAVVAIAVACQGSKPTADLAEARVAILDREATSLAGLATSLTGEAAALARSLIEAPPDPDGSTRFVPLPDLIAKSTATVPPEIASIRAETARSALDLAQRALKSEPRRLALADTLLRDVVARDPDGAEAHRLLGFVPHQGGWATPFAAGKVKDGYVRHPVFGWVEKDWMAHLDRGELPAPIVGGRPIRWLPAAEADALRAEFPRGWGIFTEHFQVRTNVPLNEAIAFGRQLESLHDLFSSLMADVIGPELPLAVLARSPKAVPEAPRRRHRVFYFARKAEYVDFLIPHQGPDVGTSLGLYLPAKEMRWRDGVGTSFFYRDEGGQLPMVETLHHEVSHQLLFESAGPDKYDPDRPNFWVFEGLGTYFETLRHLPDGSVRVGGLVGKRIEVARDRLVRRRELVPISTLVSFNRPIFNGVNGRDVYLHYAESEAVAVFLMQAEGGKYRASFLDYVADVYRGRVRPDGSKALDRRLGVGYGQLDRDLIDYLKSRPDGPR